MKIFAVSGDRNFGYSLHITPPSLLLTGAYADIIKPIIQKIPLRLNYSFTSDFTRSMSAFKDAIV
jgi:hypothetical protein